MTEAMPAAIRRWHAVAEAPADAALDTPPLDAADAPLDTADAAPIKGSARATVTRYDYAIDLETRLPSTRRTSSRRAP